MFGISYSDKRKRLEAKIKTLSDTTLDKYLSSANEVESYSYCDDGYLITFKSWVNIARIGIITNTINDYLHESRFYPQTKKWERK